MSRTIKVKSSTAHLRRLAEGAKAVDDWPLAVTYIAAAEELDELRERVAALEHLCELQRKSLEQIGYEAAAAAPRGAGRTALSAVRDLIADHRQLRDESERVRHAIWTIGENIHLGHSTAEEAAGDIDRLLAEGPP